MSARALFPAHEGKAAAERWYLVFTPIWGVVVGVVMIGGVAASWSTSPLGDLGYMALGTGLWLALVIGGHATAPASERARPWTRRAHTKIQAWMLIFAVLGNYYSEYFYEILHMHYGFGTGWNLHHVPLFLYPLTAVYFTTYATLVNLGRRALSRRLPARARPYAYLPVCFVVAGLETLLNANPWIHDLFCYEDLGFALGFGTLMYGLWFVVSAPLWAWIDERPGDDASMRDALITALAAFMLVLCVNELVRERVAPHFTTVERGAVGLDDVDGSCLSEPRPRWF